MLNAPQNIGELSQNNRLSICLQHIDF